MPIADRLTGPCRAGRVTRVPLAVTRLPALLGRLNLRYVRPFSTSAPPPVKRGSVRARRERRPVPDQVRSVAYRTLADTIRGEIRSGRYAGGRQLPTEEQLASRHSVSRQTVRRAMQDLVSEGIIYRVAGRGTYPVAEEDRYVRHFGSVEELMALSVDTECEIVSPLQRRVDIGNAGRLRLPSDELLRSHAHPPARQRAVLLHVGIPAAADRGAGQRRDRPDGRGPAQPGHGHRR